MSRSRQKCVAACCRVSQCVAVCCSVLQCVSVCCCRWRQGVGAQGAQAGRNGVLQCVAVCYSVLQCGAVCCSVLQCAPVCHSLLQCVAVCGCRQRQGVRAHGVLQGVLQCVLQYAAVESVAVCVEHTEQKPFSTVTRALQHTTTHCNTLQHTATHCNTRLCVFLYRDKSTACPTGAGKESGGALTKQGLAR